MAHREAGGQASLYRSARLDGGSWELLRTAKVDFRPYVDWFHFWIWPSSNGLAYADETSIYELDYRTGAWTERRSPNELRFLEVIGRSDGTVCGTAARVGVINMTAYVSRNGGADWMPITGPSAIRYLPRVLPDGTLLTIDGKLMKPRLHTSTDGGMTWTASEEEFRRVEDLVVLPTLGVLGTRYSTVAFVIIVGLTGSDSR